MATAVYVYKSLDDYNKFYSGKTDQLVYQIPIIDIYVDVEKGKLFVVTNQNFDETKKGIEWYRTIVSLRSENFLPLLLADKRFDVEVLWENNTVYNDKKQNLEFFRSRLGKPKMSHQVDRCVGGGDLKLYTLKYKYRFYDYTVDRINLILDSSREQGWTRIKSLLYGLIHRS